MSFILDALARSQAERQQNDQTPSPQDETAGDSSLRPAVSQASARTTPWLLAGIVASVLVAAIGLSAWWLMAPETPPSTPVATTAKPETQAPRSERAETDVSETDVSDTTLDAAPQPETVETDVSDTAQSPARQGKAVVSDTTLRAPSGAAQGSDAALRDELELLATLDELELQRSRSADELWIGPDGNLTLDVQEIEDDLAAADDDVPSWALESGPNDELVTEPTPAPRPRARNTQSATTVPSRPRPARTATAATAARPPAPSRRRTANEALPANTRTAPERNAPRQRKTQPADTAQPQLPAPSYRSLSASIRANVPRYEVNGIVYGEAPEERVAILNLIGYREGEKTRAGSIVETIRRKSVVVRHGQQRFSVSVPR